MRIVVVVVVVLVVGVGAGLLIARDDDKKSTTSKKVAVLDTEPFQAGGDLTEPPVIRSNARTHALKTTLVARNGTVSVSGVRVAGTQTYAAKRGARLTRRGILGPTLQVQPGDRIEMTLDNRLTVPTDIPAGPNCAESGDPAADATGHGHPGKAGDPQFTNLHYHGLHVTPRERSPYGDSVLIHLPNGTSRFSFKIPADHSQGTYWYHAHMHECTNDQVFRGLAGMLFIGDTRRNLLPRARYRSMKTVLLALKDIQVTKVDDTYKIDPSHFWGNPTHRTVNGLIQPKLTIRPGETQLWRLANVSAGIWYRVALVDPAKGDARDRLTIVAQDANSLRRAVRKTSLLIAPGQRFDVLVRGPASGSRVLKTLEFDQGIRTFPEDTLATVAVDGPEARSIAMPSRLAHDPQVFPAARGQTREFMFDFNLVPTDKSFFQATINNNVFNPRIAGATPILTTTERWVIYNKTDEWHPFHIHQDDFRVIFTGGGSLDGKKVEGPAPLPGVQDIVPLPPGTPEHPSKVVIEMPYTDFAGKFVFHCHILDHEDAGMMSLVDLRKRAKGERRGA